MPDNSETFCITSPFSTCISSAWHACNPIYNPAGRCQWVFWLVIPHSWLSTGSRIRLCIFLYNSTICSSLESLIQFCTAGEAAWRKTGWWGSKRLSCERSRLSKLMNQWNAHQNKIRNWEDLAFQGCGGVGKVPCVLNSGWGIRGTDAPYSVTRAFRIPKESSYPVQSCLGCQRYIQCSSCVLENQTDLPVLSSWVGHCEYPTDVQPDWVTHEGSKF